MPSLGSKTREEVRAKAKEASARIKKKAPAAAKRFDEKAAKRKGAQPKPHTNPAAPGGY